jgi:hypothetical protein
MGLFRDAVEVFAAGFAMAATDNLRNGRLLGHSWHGAGRIDRLCQEIGWGVDERTSDGVALYFNDPLVRIRKVMATEGDRLVLFQTFSAAVIPAARLPVQVLGYLLSRNTELATCAWQASVNDNNGNLAFALAYCALVEGLDAYAFKNICEVMVKEAYEFDAKMKAAGLL